MYVGNMILIKMLLWNIAYKNNNSYWHTIVAANSSIIVLSSTSELLRYWYLCKACLRLKYLIQCIQTKPTRRRFFISNDGLLTPIAIWNRLWRMNHESYCSNWRIRYTFSQWKHYWLQTLVQQTVIAFWPVICY